MSYKLIPVAKPKISFAERWAVDRVLRSGQIAQGEQVSRFEEEFSRLVSGRECVAVNSGTSGLHLGLLASGIGPGDEVIIPSFTFAATANSVALTGATPVFVDVRESDYCLDPTAVEAAISPRTSAIMPVHLYGHPAPMPEIVSIADRYGLALFEDASQAHGSSLMGSPVGTFGDFGVFSFYPTKNMTSGEGGMVTVKSESLANKIRLLRNQGMLKQYENEEVGLNNRMTDIHAAIGRAQLRKLSEWNAKRIRNAAFLDQNLRGVGTPKVAEGALHVYHQYTVRVNRNRESLVNYLRQDWAIGTGVYYPTPSHELKSLSTIGRSTDMPVTKKMASQVLSLPIHPSLSKKDLDRIVRGVNAWTSGV